MIEHAWIILIACPIAIVLAMAAIAVNENMEELPPCP